MKGAAMNQLNDIMGEIDILILEYLESGGDPRPAALLLRDLASMIEKLEKVDPATLN